MAPTTKICHSQPADLTHLTITGTAIRIDLTKAFAKLDRKLSTPIPKTLDTPRIISPEQKVARSTPGSFCYRPRPGGIRPLTTGIAALDAVYIFKKYRCTPYILRIRCTRDSIENKWVTKISLRYGKQKNIA